MVFELQWKHRRYHIRIRLIFVFFFCFLFIYLINLSPYNYVPSKQVVGWEVGVARDIRLYVLPENVTSVLGGPVVCKARVMVVVTSAPEHTAHRAAIRQTWASPGHTPPHLAVTFLLGLPHNSSQQALIEEESSLHEDIIQENFLDTYNNLTVKSVMMLKWFLSNCPDTKFLMKTDDDVFLNLTNVINIAATYNKTNLLIGYLIIKAQPILDSTSKWYCPKYLYQYSVYPNYLSGTGYMMSRDVAEKLYLTALTTPLFHLEDIYLTGICARRAGVKPRGGGRLFNMHRVSWRGNQVEIGCHPHMATMHSFSPDELLSLWATRFNCSSPGLLNPTIAATPKIFHLKKIFFAVLN